MSAPIIGEFFVKMPQVIWDECIDLTKGEFRLLGYLLRHQARSKNDRVLLTQDELLHGRRNANGARMDRGCGLSGARHLIQARERLENRGWLRTYRDGQSLVYEALYRSGEDDDKDTGNQFPKGTESVPKGNRTKNREPVPKGNRTDTPKGTESVPKGNRHNKEVEVVEAVEVKPSEANASGDETPSSKQLKKKPATSEPEEHSLHYKIRSSIQLLYQKRFQVTCPWDGSEAKILARMLASNPSWSWEDWRRMILAYFKSPDINGDRPRKWLADISRYAAGVLDRFKIPENGNGKQTRSTQYIPPAVGREATIASALQDFADREGGPGSGEDCVSVEPVGANDESGDHPDVT